MSKFSDLMRCVTCGNDKNLNISCNLCELKWCSGKCRDKYDDKHQFVCVPLYPAEHGTKEHLIKRFGLDLPLLPIINGKRFYTLPGPIEGDIPFFVIDRERDSKLYEEWKSTVIASDGVSGGCPENWYYVLDLDRVPQLIFYHLSKKQVGQIAELMEKAVKYAYGEQRQK